jgi:hypothetical protein
VDLDRENLVEIDELPLLAFLQTRRQSTFTGYSKHIYRKRSHPIVFQQ